MYALKVNQGSSAYLLCENTCVLSVWSKVMSFLGEEFCNESLGTIRFELFPSKPQKSIR